MQLVSTRQGLCATPFEAVLCGLAQDGGLFVPQTFPVLAREQWAGFAGQPYDAISAAVLGQYFAIPQQTLSRLTQQAYASFTDTKTVPLTHVHGDVYTLELFHGPTCAFKDIALQMLPLLLAYSAKQTGAAQKVLILVATSGDTGKAALCGFADKPDTAISVFYPNEGVSPAQRLQMATQTGQNVAVFAVEGDFDACQRAVKTLMGDASFAASAKEAGYTLSSANSINFGRLAPQIAYYFAAYAQLTEQGRIAAGEPVDFAVPTGNFGNILAGWYAKQMGLPVRKLIGASNRNNVLARFFDTGVYDAGGTLYRTTSPSMDILVSSNLERLLFELCGRDGQKVQQWMQLQKQGQPFDVGAEVLQRMHADFAWGWADDAAVAQTIARVYREDGVLLDPHTAVSMHVVDARQTDGVPVVVLGTASPFKFAADVLSALGQTPCGQVQADTEALAQLCGQAVPEPIAALFSQPVVHDTVLSADALQDAVLQFVR